MQLIKFIINESPIKMVFRRNIDNMCVWVCTCMCGRIDIRWMCTFFFYYMYVCLSCMGRYMCFLMYFYMNLSIRVCFCVYFWKYSIIIQIHVEFMKYIKKNIRSWLIRIQYSLLFIYFFFTFFIVANILSKVITILCFVWRIYYHNSVLYTNVFFSA